MSTAPGTSSRAGAEPGPAAAGRPAGRNSSDPSTASAPIGTLIQKTQCQSRPCTTAPPTSGPPATARPPRPPQMPTMAPRLAAGNDEARMVSASGVIAAAPIPWTARAAMSVPGARGERAEGGRHGEHGDPGNVGAPPPEPFADRRGGDDPGREGQRVRVDRPVKRPDRTADRPVDGGQGRHHHERVERHHEEGHRGQREDQPRRCRPPSGPGFPGQVRTRFRFLARRLCERGRSLRARFHAIPTANRPPDRHPAPVFLLRFAGYSGSPWRRSSSSRSAAFPADSAARAQAPRARSG